MPVARYVVAYAHPPAQPDRGVPLAVVAQDDRAVVVEAVPQDVMALARQLGLPSQTFVGWVAGRQSAIKPLDRPKPDGSIETWPVTDVRWLHAFVDTGYADVWSFGPITEAAGIAADVARQQVQSLAASHA
jgi:hypothetical protein